MRIPEKKKVYSVKDPEIIFETTDKKLALIVFKYFKAKIEKETQNVINKIVEDVDYQIKEIEEEIKIIKNKKK